MSTDSFKPTYTDTGSSGISTALRVPSWKLLVLLWIAFFLNQADRQIFSVVLPLIKADLKLTDAELGLIASALVWTYGCLVPVAGFAGDRLSRKKIIGFSLLFWSLATLLTGWCATLTEFVLLRGLATGGGEAFYAPSANAMLSEEYPQKRSLALSIHQTAVYAGVILSGLIAGYIAQQFGWRSAFLLFGGLGIIIAIVIFLFVKKDKPSSGAVKVVSFIVTLKILLRTPTALLLTVAFACMVFVNVGYLTWMPLLLIEKFNLSITSAGFTSVLFHHIGAFMGVVGGGAISDKFAGNKPNFRLKIQAICLLLGAPFIYLVGQGHSLSITYAALFLFGLFRGGYDANIFASLYEVVKPGIRSTASGLMLMLAFLTGAFAPFLLGYLKPTLGLTGGISWLWVSYCIGACAITAAILFYFKTDHLKSISVA